MAQSISDGDFFVQGTLGARVLRVPAGTILDAAVGGQAGIDAAKLDHEHRLTYSQEAATNAALDNKVVHVVAGTAGTLVAWPLGWALAGAVEAGAVVAATGNALVKFDILKGGATVLASQITLSAGIAAYSLVPGTISTASLLDSNVLSVKVALASAGTGALPKGIFASVRVTEDYA